MRTVTKAMSHDGGVVVVDTPPGEGNVVQAALSRADAVVIPTRAGGGRAESSGDHAGDDAQ